MRLQWTCLSSTFRRATDSRFVWWTLAIHRRDLRKTADSPRITDWHLDPNVNVFVNPDLSAHGAEQFRTLRSRLYQMRAAQPLRTLSW